jgi:hypothetical protein
MQLFRNCFFSDLQVNASMSLQIIILRRKMIRYSRGMLSRRSEGHKPEVRGESVPPARALWHMYLKYFL